MRPFDFMVPFWGRRYREYWVDLSLPSLLAPNNLPLLDAADGHRFLIATTEEDWEAIRGLPIMTTLQRHATPTWIKIDPWPQEVYRSDHHRYEASIRQQNGAQKALVRSAGERGAYGSMTFPDLIYSDGMVATLLRLAREGSQAAFLPAMRQVEEDVLDDLAKHGYLPAGEKSSLTSRPLHIPQRVMAELAVKHLHPEMELYDQAYPAQKYMVPFRYWRLDDGLILHTFYGCLPFIDYAAMPKDHAGCLDQGALENVYASNNFKLLKRIDVVADSDEFAVVSLTPRTVNWAPPHDFAPSPWWLPGYARLLHTRKSMKFYAGTDRDTIRRDLFLTTVRWHANDVGFRWRSKEFRIGCLLRLAVGDYITAARRGEFPTGSSVIDKFEAALAILPAISERRQQINQRISARQQQIFHAILHVTRRVRRLAYRLTTLVLGDASARKWLVWRISVISGRLRGRTDHPPAPGLTDEQTASS